MKSIVIDSSSAILLYRCNLIPSLLEYSLPLIPGTVFDELTVPGHDGAELFSEICGSGRIKVYEPDSAGAAEINGSLHAGERDVIALFLEGKGEFIIIDDGKGGGFCRDNSIPYINALLAVKIMFFKKLITEPEYNNAWRWLLANGRYSDRVIVWAENADEQSLAAFM